MIRLSMRLGFRGLLGALGFVAALISLAGFLGALAWWLEILSHFRVQYAVVFLLLATLFAAGRRGHLAAGALALALVNALPVLLFRFPPAPPPSAAAPVFRAMLINVNSHSGNPAAVGTAITQASPDFLVLEEISDRWLHALAPALETYPFRKTAPRHDNFGIGLFSRHPIKSARIVPFGLVDIPSIFAECRIGSQRLTLVATHPMPPGDALLAAERDRHLDWIAREIPSLPGPVLLLGDLNTTPWSPVYRRFARNSGLMNSAQGRSIHPTWPAFLPLLWIPLDHVLHSPDIAIHAHQVGPDVGSDHLPVRVDFSFAPNP
jgi:endonuclease/exonuclease/phosphatase (EEP) superfamily protein YafD